MGSCSGQPLRFQEQVVEVAECVQRGLSLPRCRNPGQLPAMASPCQQRKNDILLCERLDSVRRAESHPPPLCARCAAFPWPWTLPRRPGVRSGARHRPASPPLLTTRRHSPACVRPSAGHERPQQTMRLHPANHPKRRFRGGTFGDISRSRGTIARIVNYLQADRNPSPLAVRLIAEIQFWKKHVSGISRGTASCSVRTCIWRERRPPRQSQRIYPSGQPGAVIRYNRSRQASA